MNLPDFQDNPQLWLLFTLFTVTCFVTESCAKHFILQEISAMIQAAIFFTRKSGTEFTTFPADKIQEPALFHL